MILENLVTFVGALLKHIIGVLLLCWRRMLRAGLIAFAIGAVVTALVEVLGTGEVIPSVMSLIVALLFGLALAYGVALTVLVEELVLGLIDLIRMIEGDISAGAHIAEVVAEREVGQVGQGLRRMVGLPVSKRAPTRPGAKLPPLIRERTPGQQSVSPAPRAAQPLSAQPQPARPATPPPPTTQPPTTQPPTTQPPATQPPATQPTTHLPGSLAASSLIEAGAALAVKAAAAAAISAAAQHATPAPPASPPAAAASATPPTEPSGEPVPADRLPRIEWTYEHEAIRPPAAPSADATPSATPEAAEPLSEATTPIAEAAAPVSSAAPSAPASGDLPRTLAELAGANAPGAPTPFTPADASEDLGATPAAAALEAPYEDERLAAPASIAMPDGPAEPAERQDETARDAEEAPEVVSGEPVEPAPGWPTPSSGAAPAGGEEAPEAVSAEPVELAPEWSRSPGSAAQVVVDAPAEPAEAAEIPADAGQPSQEGAPASRSDFSRRTLPLSDTGPSVEGPRAEATSGPRPSAPESGLWERLSSALISRTGAPSGPFAPAPPSQPDDESATDDAAPQEPEPRRDA
ncbi:MAG TPA: hypothetical protein VFQ25_15000 [Ktedonobacterales bacterium]|nr:hypothetical protein [Ktedonobacterales bacterium]